MKTSSKENIQTHSHEREDTIEQHIFKTEQQHNNNKTNKTNINKTNTKQNIQTHRSEKEDTIEQHVFKIEQHHNNNKTKKGK